MRKVDSEGAAKPPPNDTWCIYSNSG